MRCTYNDSLSRYTVTFVGPWAATQTNSDSDVVRAVRCVYVPMSMCQQCALEEGASHAEACGQGGEEIIVSLEKNNDADQPVGQDPRLSAVVPERLRARRPAAEAAAATAPAASSDPAGSQQAATSALPDIEKEPEALADVEM